MAKFKSKNNQGQIIIPFWEKLCCRFCKITPYTHYRVIQEIIRHYRKDNRNKGKILRNRVRFILRVDDFPRWDLPIKHFLKCDAILAKFGIEYCLGVTPQIALDPLNPFSECEPGLSDDAADILQKISKRVEISLHGLTHRVLNHNLRSEFNGLKPSIIEKYIVNGLNLLHDVKLTSVSFIPPFNSISIPALPILAQYFKILFGGPESITTLGFYKSPSFLGEMIYLPSYPPAYDRAQNMCNFVKQVKQINLPLIIPLTIHWAWEERDKFYAFEKLCQELVGWTISRTQIRNLSVNFNNYFLD